MKSSMAIHWPHFRLRTWRYSGSLLAYWREAEVEGAIRPALPDPIQ
jgi:hypothetical protein